MALDNDADGNLVDIDIENAFKYEWLKYCRAVGKPNEFPTAASEKAHAAVEKELATINALPASLLRRAFSGEL